MKSRSLSLLPAWILAAAIGLLTSVTQAQSGDPATRLGKPAVPPHQRLPEPRLNGNSFTLKLYGSDPDVSLLAGLLADEDALVREQAAIGLGQTDNLRALPHIRRATQDPKPKVRSAAVWAAAQFPAARSGGIILSALEDADRQVVWTALRAVRSVKGGPLEAARPALQRLLGADDAALQAAALATLTHLRLPAGAATLRALLASTSPSVRLRAAENAVLVAEAAAKPSIPALMKLARRDTAGVRGAAVAALGRLDFGGSKDLIDRAGRDGPAGHGRRSRGGGGGAGPPRLRRIEGPHRPGRAGREPVGPPRGRPGAAQRGPEDGDRRLSRRPLADGPPGGDSRGRGASLRGLRRAALHADVRGALR